MNRYTIYCTAEQTRKALELGAPIQFTSINDIRLGRYIEVESNNETYKIPTAEQMIEWLEEQGLIIEIHECNGYYFFAIFHKEGLGSFASHKEATIAAIDAALEYLTSMK